MAEVWIDLSPASLHQALRESGNEVVLLTTYNIYFPFVEGVVVRRLWAAGVKLVIVMADAACVAEACADPIARPRLAGRNYALLPVKAARSFHPKLMVLAGKRHQQVMVGSHNLTLSGFGHNREITNRLTDAADVRAAWAFARSWANLSTLPAEQVSRLFELAENLAPALRPVPSDPPESAFVGAEASGPSLWSMLQRRLPAKARDLVVLGPYLDGELAFVRRLLDTLRPETALVAVDPAIGALRSDATHSLPGARFVNAQALDLEATGPVHGKLIWIRDERGEEWLVSGSANPTAAAYLASDAGRNAEAVVLRGPAPDGAFYAGLHLGNLESATELTVSDWDAMAKRMTSAPAGGDSRSALLVGIAGPEGITIQAQILATVVVEAATVLGAGDTAPKKAKNVCQTGNRCVVQPYTDGAVLVELLLTDNDAPLRVLVFHPSQLEARARTGRQQAFHEALSTFETDLPDVDGLLGIVEKVIFDEEPPLRPDLMHRGGLGQGPNPTQALPIPETLEVSPASLEHRFGRRRSALAAGDLALVLDALISKLGDTVATGVSEGQGDDGVPVESEEELVGKDDEGLLVPEPRVENRIALAAACEKKLLALIRRLKKYLELAREDVDSIDYSKTALRSAARTAAVLGIIRTLKERDERRQGPRSESRLVSERVQIEVVNAVLRGFFYGPKSLAHAAWEAEGKSANEELSVCRGLTAWLMLANGWDRTVPTGSLDSDVTADLNLKLSELLMIFLDVYCDGRATDLASNALHSTMPVERIAEAEALWVDHLHWAARLQQIVDDPLGSTEGIGEPQVGDLVFQPAASTRQISVVARVVPDRLALMAPRTNGDKPAIYVVSKVESLRRPFRVIHCEG